MFQLRISTLLLVLFMISKWRSVAPLSDLKWRPTSIDWDASNSSSVDALWKAFKQLHGRSYDDAEEETLRRQIFVDNIKAVNRHNRLHWLGLRAFKTTINKFADMELSEFKKTFNGYRQSVATGGIGRHNSTALFSEEHHEVDLPRSIDWRLHGLVASVKDQGDCGSCWAFSATGALEGQHYRKTGQLVQLSEQNLIDCSSDFGNHGCDGGVMDAAFQYVMMNRGIDTEQSYPYEAKNGKCRYTIATIGATAAGFVNLLTGSERKLMEAVATVGPVSAAVDGSRSSFRFYDRGIYDDPDCSSSSPNHGVLVVGYGREHGIDYWLLKNSWGKWWGEEGYMKMARNRSNLCGIASAASYPLV